MSKKVEDTGGVLVVQKVLVVVEVTALGVQDTEEALMMARTVRRELLPKVGLYTVSLVGSDVLFVAITGITLLQTVPVMSVTSVASEAIG